MTVERGSDKHNPIQDDELEKEMRGFLQGDHPTHSEEDLEAEAPTEDDPAALRPEPPHPGDGPE